MNNDNISRIAASDHIKNRLIQTAMNNMEDFTTYEKVCVDIVENRLDTWLNEVPAVKTARIKAKWLRGECYPHHIYCSECYKTFIPNDEWVPWVQGDVPRKFCPNCGAKMEEQT